MHASSAARRDLRNAWLRLSLATAAVAALAGSASAAANARSTAERVDAGKGDVVVTLTVASTPTVYDIQLRRTTR